MQFEGVPSLAKSVSICYAKDSPLHHTTAPSRWTMNHHGWVRPEAHPLWLCALHHTVGWAPLPQAPWAHAHDRHPIVSTSGYHQPHSGRTQQQRPSEGTSNHLERAQYKLQLMHLAFQPWQTADPSNPIRLLFDHPTCVCNYSCRNYRWLRALRQSRDHVWISAKAIAEELETISAFPMGWQSSWQAIVWAQPKTQLILQIIIICSKALVPGGYPVIVYFCKEWLFWITE